MNFFITRLTNTEHYLEKKTRLVIGLAQQRPGFDPMSFHVKLMLDKVALRQDILRVLRFSPVSIVPTMVTAHSYPTNDIYS